jgi:hypothetical protein
MANRKKAVKEGDTRRREYERNYRRQKSEEANDIGELPLPENPKRKKACEHDLVKFCSTYLPEYFFRPWSKAQLEIAKNVEKVIENGGSQAIAHKRRGAKTTICLGGLMWAMLYGKHMYSYFVAASNGATLDAKAFFDLELMENDLLFADFPEVCVPIRKTEGIKQRNPSYHGQKCNIEMTGDTVRLPTMRIYKKGKLQKTSRGKPAHYPASSALIKFISIGSTVARGRGIAFADRPPSRPSLALVDDPQNDGAAKSELQIQGLDDFIRKTIAPMTEVGSNGCQTLFDDLSEIITPYAKQQCAMVPDMQSRVGIDYDHWVLRKPAIYNKEFFDTNAGSWMIASFGALFVPSVQHVTNWTSILQR